jgi:hypothetical protein
MKTLRPGRAKTPPVAPLAVRASNGGTRPQLRRRAPEDDASGNHAFVGSATLPIAGGIVSVQALCWPSVLSGWEAMALALGSVREWQHAPTSSLKGQSISWIAKCAPQLGGLFNGTPAEESSLAAILVRTGMSVAVSVVDGLPATARTDQRRGLLECLSVYDSHVGVPGRSACRVLVARASDEASGLAWADAFSYSQRRLPDAAWIHAMQLRVWTEAIDPLPLEVANVIAGSVARYRVDGQGYNPIVHAVRTKLSSLPSLLDRVPGKRR